MDLIELAWQGRPFQKLCVNERFDGLALRNFSANHGIDTNTPLLICLKDCRFLSSEAIGYLVAISRIFEENDTPYGILCVQQNAVVSNIFKVVRLDSILNFVPDEESFLKECV